MKKIITLIIFCLLIIVSVIKAENYAIIITGCEPDTVNYSIPEELSYDMLWNDTFLMWETLWKFGWKDENIYVLFGNGVDFPYEHYDRYDAEDQYGFLWDIDHIVDDSAYFDDVEQVIDHLDTTMTEDDFLFVNTFGHGGPVPSGDTVLCLMGGDSIPNYDLADMLDDLPYDRRVIWISHCYSGGFIDYLKNNNTVIMTSCDSDETADMADNNEADAGDSLEYDYNVVPPDTFEYYHHSEFNYHAQNAARMETIVEANEFSTHDFDANGLADLEEIFYWVEEKNSMYELIPIPPNTDTTWLENPQYSDEGGIGDEVFLNIEPTAPVNLDIERRNNSAPD